MKAKLAIYCTDAIPFKKQAKLIYRLAIKKGYEPMFVNWIRVHEVYDKKWDMILWVISIRPTLLTGQVAPMIEAQSLDDVKACVYGVIEGPFKPHIATTSPFRFVEFVVPSNFVKSVLEESGFKVKGVVHHAVDIKIAEKALYYVKRIRK